MAEKSSFFTSIDSDRVYKAEDFAEYFGTFIGNGVFPNPSTALSVSASTGMKVVVSAGSAFINGYMYSNTENLELTLAAAHSSLKRIDRVVVRCDQNAREITIKVKSGTPASTPIAPALERSASVYELAIADILVHSAITSISQSNITSTKLDNKVCGIVTQTVETIDTTTLYNKLEAYINERGVDVDAWIEESTQAWEKDFIEWFDTIKGILDGDVAANLTNRIVALEQKVGSGLTADNILMKDGQSVEEAINGSRVKLINYNNGIVYLL